MIINIPGEQIDNILFDALRAVYQLQNLKVNTFGLNYEDIYLLQYLRRQSPSRMSELAKEMNIPISTATRVIDRLQKRKYLSREKDVADKRNILASLKPEGERIVKEVEEQTFVLITKNLARFSAEEIAAFVATAENLQEILKID